MSGRIIKQPKVIGRVSLVRARKAVRNILTKKEKIMTRPGPKRICRITKGKRGWYWNEYVGQQITASGREPFHNAENAKRGYWAHVNGVRNEDPEIEVVR